MIPQGTARQSLKEVGAYVSAFFLVWDRPKLPYPLHEKCVYSLLGTEAKNPGLRLNDPFRKDAVVFSVGFFSPAFFPKVYIFAKPLLSMSFLQ